MYLEEIGCRGIVRGRDIMHAGTLQSLIAFFLSYEWVKILTGPEHL